VYKTANTQSNHVRLRISPDVTIALGTMALSHDRDDVDFPIEMIASRLPRAGEMDAYERVLGDAMHGDATLFAREDYVEEAWRIVDPALKANTPIYPYEPGTWGPAEIDGVSPPDGWHNPSAAN
jgi:glucose-6-phosphate 1-dehydrogenase